MSLVTKAVEVTNLHMIECSMCFQYITQLHFVYVHTSFLCAHVICLNYIFDYIVTKLIVVICMDLQQPYVPKEIIMHIWLCRFIV